jgi:hypothetical protein
MIKKLLERFGFAPAKSPLMLEKRLQEQPLTQMGDGELGSTQPPLEIPKQP